MLIPFENLPEEARIWIYQSDKPLDDPMIIELEARLRSFINQWEAHGQSLQAAAKILHNRFLVIGVDEGFNPVTGCSTDASVNFVRMLGDEFGIDFFNRTQMPIMVNETVELVGLDKFRKKDLPQSVTTETLTFDNLIQTKGQLENSWQKPVGETWLAKYL